MPKNGERGFTMIELLVVILIIGILLAIVIPTFINQRSKGQDAEAKSAVAVASRALEIYNHDHDTYAAPDRTALEDIEISLRQARNLVVRGTDDGYTVSVDSASGGSGGGPFTIERVGDDVTRTCDGPGKGSCPPSGEW
jgi:type IV pilus assembly protein PilA